MFLKTNRDELYDYRVSHNFKWHFYFPTAWETLGKCGQVQLETMLIHEISFDLTRLKYLDEAC